MEDTKQKVIGLIEELLNHTYSTEEKGNLIMNNIINSVAFGKDIIDTIYWGTEYLNATQIYEKAEKDYKPIIL